MIAWLTDTLWATGALIAVVLVLRRPVARVFGPRLAYALWLLPLLRMAMPPIVLPGWSREVVTTEIVFADAAAGQGAAPGSSLADWLVPIWLAGAGLFLAWHAVRYIAMRRQLLRNAAQVDCREGVRIVESPAIDGPVAFGVIDKVIAVPSGFFAANDHATRELALAHELGHHRGHDLFFNLIAQPLLALHWCNPLAWAGWRAMRRDQEAACDARVVAAGLAPDRAAYARVIAHFALSARPSRALALAAPMACPVLGDKSIIHRLRSLTMSPRSRRRLMSGQFALAGTIALALPITATISHADDATVEMAQAAPPPPPAMPAAPPAPAVVPVDIKAPAPPAAPVAPDAPKVKQVIIVERHGDKDGTVPQHFRTLTRDGKTVTIHSDKPIDDAELEAKLDKIEKRVVVRDGDIERDVLVRAPDCGQVVATAQASSGGEDKRRAVIKVCAKAGEARADALKAVQKARARVAANGDLAADLRQQILSQLDAEIAKLSKES